MKNITFLLFLSCQLSVFAQRSIPYYNFFEKSSDTVGWSHSASSGNDDWQFGKTITGNSFYDPYSFPNCWATNIDSLAKLNSNRSLVSPFFDLSDGDKHYRLLFKNKRQGYNGKCKFYVEYSIGKDTSWSLLYNSSAKQVNWQNANGFSYTTSNSFHEAATNLNFIGNYDSVQFRFRYKTSAPAGHGWIIDDFFIEEDLLNVSAQQGADVYSSINCQLTTLHTTIGIHNPFSEKFYVQTKIYWSKNKVIDSQDSLLMELSTYINVSTEKVKSIDLNSPENLDSGVYYIVYSHTISSGEEEYTYLDNESFARVLVQEVGNLPTHESFDDNGSGWHVETESRSPSKLWKAGKGFLHHTEGTHSGEKAWHCNNSIHIPWDSDGEFLWSPYFDLTSDSQDLVLNIWFKSVNGGCTVNARVDCEKYGKNVGSLYQAVDDDWDYRNIDLSSYKDKTTAQFGFYFTHPNKDDRNVMIDDFYLGSAKPDLSIEREKDRFTASSEDSLSLKYLLTNCGLKPAKSMATAFYWSTSGLFDGTETLLDVVTFDVAADTNVWKEVRLNKLSTSGDFFILYHLDTANQIEEMREYNNQGCFNVYQFEMVKGAYFNDFEEDTLHWRHNASLGNDDWTIASPKGDFAEWDFVNNKAWVTNNDSLISDMSRMHLYSPIFELSKLTSPVLEFDLVRQSGSYLDETGINMSYSVDGGATWAVLDTTSQSFNRWYYPIEYDHGIDRDHFANHSDLLHALTENVFAGTPEYNSRDVLINHHYVLDITNIDRTSPVQFRFNLATNGRKKENPSNPFTFINEGVMMDNFKVSEATTDLRIRWKNEFYLSNTTDSFDISAQIWNDGNYLSPGTTVSFYISDDTLLSTDDSMVGIESLPSIRPGFARYTSPRIRLPKRYKDDQFLIYFLDDKQVIDELSEKNNIGYWPIHFYGLNQFPYTQDFNDTILEGWHTYSIHHWGWPGRGNLRVRNQRVPAEYTSNFHYFESNTLFIERYETWYGLDPAFIIETPTFDFSSDSNLILSFDLFCKGLTGKNGDGGNFEYSLDNGTTWTVITNATTTGKNWYGTNTLKGLNNEPGWHTSWGLESSMLDLVYTWLDLSFLNGEHNVKFRFKYISANPQMSSTRRYGFQLDNFRIGKALPDLWLKNLSTSAIPFQSDSVTATFSIENAGKSIANSSMAKIYVSLDQKLDTSDQLVSYHVLEALSGEQQITDSITFALDVDACTSRFYLYMEVDSEDNLEESNEDNNSKWLEVNILPGWDLTAVTYIDSHTMANTLGYFKYRHAISTTSNATSIPFTTEYYWSHDAVLDTSDLLVGIHESPEINACDSAAVVVKFKFPRNNSNAFGYLIYQVDATNAIEEQNEEDNQGMTKFIFKQVVGIENISMAGVELFSNGGEIVLRTGTQLNNLTLKIYTSEGKLIDVISADILNPNKEIRVNPALSGLLIVFAFLVSDEGILVNKVLLSKH